KARAVSSLHQGLFTFPNVSTEGDVVAFLESEAGEKFCDETGDADRLDSILRVFKLGLTELTSGVIAVEADPKVNSQAVLVSNGIVYYRHSENAQAQTPFEIASVSTANVQGNSDSATFGGPVPGGPALSGDGRFVAFSSAANNLVAGDTNGVADIFVRDR